jgi:hypothetical protein
MNSEIPTGITTRSDMKGGENTVWMSHPTARDVRAHHEARVAQMRRELHGPRRARPQQRPVRRWVGRQLVRAGTALAADPTMRPARAR